jgi:hypothetical protein
MMPLRAPRSEGRLNLVFVEDAASDIIHAAQDLAAPASESMGGDFLHPNLSAMSSNELYPIEYFKGMTPHIRRFRINNDFLKQLIRMVEIRAIS